MSEAIGGRWCGQAVFSPQRGYQRCGGELLYRRRLEGERIVSYLVCQFCGHQTPMLACDTDTGEHRNLLIPPAAAVEHERQCQFCRAMKPRSELEFRPLTGIGDHISGYALGCREGCS